MALPRGAVWIYDLRTNLHFTLKENTLKRSDLDDFVACYNPKNRHERKESERFKSFTYEELTKRDKVNLDMLTHAPRAFGTASLRFAQSVSLASWRLGSG